MITKLTPKQVAQIAAGEVVERPMNIAKELIENSIDAGADKISIQLENGGLDLLRIIDNGSGIRSSELETAFELHTTSKLTNIDLMHVKTLGFRGEALSSISSVSLVECISKHSSENQAMKIIIEGGQVKSKTPSNFNIGTSITIKSLFYNIPARRKFLKKPATERKRISQLITTYILMYPEIHFELLEKVSGKYKTKLNSPKRKGILPAVFDALGDEVANNIVKISGSINRWNVNGFVSKPILFRKDRSLQFICVNGRIVNHLELQEGIEKVYGSQLMKSSHPVIILNINGPVDGIDFNIHPKKEQIRFESDDDIIYEISKLVENSLNKTHELPKLNSTKLNKISTKPATSLSKNLSSISSQIQPKGINNPITESKRVVVQTTLDDSNPIPLKTYKEQLKEEKVEKIKPKKQEFLSTNKGSFMVGDKKILGHIMKKFAIIDAGDEFWLMDVHASDERVKFELYEKRQGNKILSQQFLEPLKISMIPMEKQLILDNLKLIEQKGMKIVDGSSDILLVYSVPIFYNSKKIDREMVKEMLHEMYEMMVIDEKNPVKTIFDRMEYKIVANLACHGSIRSGYHVSNDVIADVLKNLLKCSNPWTCAHGRPTILRVSNKDLISWFKR